MPDGQLIQPAIHRRLRVLACVATALLAFIAFAPGLLERHTATDDLHDVGAGDQIIDEGLRNPAGHSAGSLGQLSR